MRNRVMSSRPRRPLPLEERVDGLEALVHEGALHERRAGRRARRGTCPTRRARACISAPAEARRPPSRWSTPGGPTQFCAGAELARRAGDVRHAAQQALVQFQTSSAPSGASRQALDAVLQRRDVVAHLAEVSRAARRSGDAATSSNSRSDEAWPACPRCARRARPPGAGTARRGSAGRAARRPGRLSSPSAASAAERRSTRSAENVRVGGSGAGTNACCPPSVAARRPLAAGPKVAASTTLPPSCRCHARGTAAHKRAASHRALSQTSGGGASGGGGGRVDAPRPRGRSGQDAVRGGAAKGACGDQVRRPRAVAADARTHPPASGAPGGSPEPRDSRAAQELELLPASPRPRRPRPGRGLDARSITVRTIAALLVVALDLGDERSGRS